MTTKRGWQKPDTKEEGIRVYSYGVEIPAPPGDSWVAVMRSTLPNRGEWAALKAMYALTEVLVKNHGNLELIKGLLEGAGSLIGPKVVQDILDALDRVRELEGRENG